MEACRWSRGGGAVREDFTPKAASGLTLGRGLWLRSKKHMLKVFELWCWRRLLAARRSNQSILKKINPEYSLEGLMLKLQYFGHLMQRADSLEKTLMLRKTESRRRREQKRMRQLDGITNSMDMLLLLLLSRFSCVRLLATPWTAAYKAPPSMRLSRQEYWSRMPLPSPKGHEFEQIPRDGEGQGRLVCCSPGGRKESETTQQLNNNKVELM